MTEEQLEKSSVVIKLLIRGKNFEISTEGTASDVYKELDVLAQLANAVSEKLGLREEIPKPAVVVKKRVPSVAEVPVFKPSKSTTKNIQSLFDTRWGKKPRNAAEVADALEVNAVPDSLKNISVYLMRLVKKGVLRRIKKEGKWYYYRIPTAE